MATIEEIFEEQRAQIALLRRSILDDAFKDFETSGRRWLRKIIQPFAWPSVHRFAKIAARFDEYVEMSGLRDGMRQIMPSFVRGVDVRGTENVPEKGPLLVVSNHPGTYDSIVIAATLPRNDLRIIASGYPFLRRLPAASQHMIFASNNPHERMSVVRSAARHLKNGKSVLIFPRGRVEPDPVSLPGASDSIQNWSPSLELFLRIVPNTQIMITIVSGVLSPVFLRNPLIRFWKEGRDPQTVAETIQVVTQMLFPSRVQLIPQISFGNPLSMDELRKDNYEQGILDTIISRSKQMLADHCTWYTGEPKPI